jgi:hypothetical protein
MNKFFLAKNYHFILPFMSAEREKHANKDF